jgi:hypothetical protein
MRARYYKLRKQYDDRDLSIAEYEEMDGLLYWKPLFDKLPPRWFVPRLFTKRWRGTLMCATVGFWGGAALAILVTTHTNVDLSDLKLYGIAMLSLECMIRAMEAWVGR